MEKTTMFIEVAQFTASILFLKNRELQARFRFSISATESVFIKFLPPIVFPHTETHFAGTRHPSGFFP